LHEKDHDSTGRIVCAPYVISKRRVPEATEIRAEISHGVEAVPMFKFVPFSGFEAAVRGDLPNEEVG